MSVRYRVSGTSSWTTESASSNSLSLSGLSSTTQYEAQVRSKCSDGTSSAYSSSVSFTTTEVQLVYVIQMETMFLTNISVECN